MLVPQLQRRQAPPLLVPPAQATGYPLSFRDEEHAGEEWTSWPA